MKTKKLLKTLSLGLVFAFAGCTDCNDDCPPSNENLGKVNIYIEGNITNAEAQAKLTAQIGTQTENIYVQNTTQLTDITINAVGDMRDIVIKNNATLANITINGNNSKGNLIEINSNTIMNTTLYGFYELNYLLYQNSKNNNQFICNDLITIINTAYISSNQGILKFNHLKYIKTHEAEQWTNENNDVNNGFKIYGSFSVFELPVLEEVQRLELCVYDETVSFPALKRIFTLQPNPANGQTYFETINLPVLEEVKGVFVVRNTSNDITLNMPMLNYCQYIDISEGSKLSSGTVNAILNKFLTVLPATDKVINLKYQNPAAPPTGVGLQDKQTLITQGNYVLTD